MSMLMRKNQSQSHTNFNKLVDQGRVFGQKNNSQVYRKVHNTISDFKGYADPVLMAGSLMAPEFAPLFGGAQLGLIGANALSGYAAKQAKFVEGSNRQQKRNQLEK